MNDTSSVGVDKPNPWWLRYVREDPGVVLTVLYLLLTVIGAFYNWRLCARFGINILDLADVTDFLMFAVRDAAVVFLAFFEISLFIGMYVLMASVARTPFEKRKGLMKLLGRNIKSTKDLRPVAISTTFCAVFFTFYVLNSYSGNVASGIKAGKGRSCEVAFSEGEKGPLQPAQFVTATSRFVVVYRPEDKSTHVIAVEGIGHLVFKP